MEDRMISSSPLENNNFRSYPGIDPRGISPTRGISPSSQSKIWRWVNIIFRSYTHGHRNLHVAVHKIAMAIWWLWSVVLARLSLWEGRGGPAYFLGRAHFSNAPKTYARSFSYKNLNGRNITCKAISKHLLLLGLAPCVESVYCLIKRQFYRSQTLWNCLTRKAISSVYYDKIAFCCFMIRH